MDKARIFVSPEMLAFVGAGRLPRSDWPATPVGFAFDLGDASFAHHTDPMAADAIEDADIVLIVAREACDRIFGITSESGCWHLPTDVRAIALAIRDCPLPDSPRETLRLAKSIELLCATFAVIAEGSLVPCDGAGELSASEAQQIVAARRLIDERWREKLTLDAIARACGLNRAKLTRGFRSMFDCSVTDAIAERRLGGARQMLLATDLSVSSVGFACGYLNNASFTRAFSRRFGLPPTQLRAAA